MKTAALDPQELIFALLFWDKLDFPTNDFMHTGLDPNAEFLVSAGILKRTPAQIPLRGDGAQYIARAHVHTYQTLDKQEPGVWSLGTGKNSMSFSGADIENDRGALIRIYQAIPVPDKDVPFQDILEFRSKRNDELLALRYHLETIYQRIVAAGDGALALNTEIGALEQAIVAYIKGAKESNLSFRNMSFNANLNIPAGVAAGLTAFTMQLGIVSSLFAGTTAAFGFGPGVSLKGRTAAPTPFQYISSYHEKIF